MVNTLWSASSGALVSIAMGQWASGKPGFSLVKALNGAIAGAVCICASAVSVRPWGALVIGAIGGCVYRLISRLLTRLKIDDPIDAVPVHFGAGLTGLLCQPIFNYGTGIVYTFVCVTCGLNHVEILTRDATNHRMPTRGRT